MRVVHGWKGLPAGYRGAAVALGNFDGVHLGHQRVIAEARDAATSLGAHLGVISFEPHARLHFQPNSPPFRLMRPAQLARALRELSVDTLYLLPFGAEMAGLSDKSFAREVLASGLGARHVAVGFDITFGKGRSGDPAAMRRYGAMFGFGVSVAEPFTLAGEKVSSSAIREALRRGEPTHAARLLGRPFAIEGVVQKGRQLGRRLGFPTANVDLGDYVAPRFGVYAVRARLANGRRFDGVANLGVNPTTGVVAPRVETWLFDFDEDIYGESLETELIAFLRPEERFATIEAMTAQVRRDADDARAVLARTAAYRVNPNTVTVL